MLRITLTILFAHMAGCSAMPPVDDEACGKLMASRKSYLQCLSEKDVAACEHLLRLYQADAQVFVASGCARTMGGARRLMQSPTW